MKKKRSTTRVMDVLFFSHNDSLYCKFPHIEEGKMFKCVDILNGLVTYFSWNTKVTERKLSFDKSKKRWYIGGD